MRRDLTRLVLLRPIARPEQRGVQLAQTERPSVLGFADPASLSISQFFTFLFFFFGWIYDNGFSKSEC